MKRQIMVLAVFVTIIAVILCGCRIANKVPGVSAVGSAVASVMPSLPPTLQPSATQNTTGPSPMPLVSASAPAATKTK